MISHRHLYLTVKMLLPPGDGTALSTSSIPVDLVRGSKRNRLMHGWEKTRHRMSSCNIAWRGGWYGVDSVELELEREGWVRRGAE
jgi:hypothetical protein